MNRILTILLLALLLVGCGGDDEQNSKSDTQLRGTPEELAQRAFNAFIKSDKQAYQGLTLANLSKTEWVSLIEEVRAAGKAPDSAALEKLTCSDSISG